MSLLWIAVQLVFWCALVLLVGAVMGLAVLAPPYIAYRIVRKMTATPSRL